MLHHRCCSVFELLSADRPPDLRWGAILLRGGGFDVFRISTGEKNKEESLTVCFLVARDFSFSNTTSIEIVRGLQRQHPNNAVHLGCRDKGCVSMCPKSATLDDVRQARAVALFSTSSGRSEYLDSYSSTNEYLSYSEYIIRTKVRTR